MRRNHLFHFSKVVVVSVRREGLPQSDSGSIVPSLLGHSLQVSAVPMMEVFRSLERCVVSASRDAALLVFRGHRPQSVALQARSLAGSDLDDACHQSQKVVVRRLTEE